MQLWHPLFALLAPVAAEPDLLQGCEMCFPSSPSGPDHRLSDRRGDHFHMPALVLHTGSPLSALSVNLPFSPGCLGHLHHLLPAEISENDCQNLEYQPRTTTACRYLAPTTVISISRVRVPVPLGCCYAKAMWVVIPRGDGLMQHLILTAVRSRTWNWSDTCCVSKELILCFLINAFLTLQHDLHCFAELEVVLVW